MSEMKDQFSFRSKLIDALLDIRLTLSVKKLTSDFIKKTELKTILDDAKQKAQNLEIGKEIDKVFAEYFETGPKAANLQDDLSVEQLQKVIDNASDNAYQESGDIKGRAFVKTDGYHRSGGEINVNSSTTAA